MSGVPYTLVTLRKLPTLNVVTPALTVAKSLALFISLSVVPICSISKPWTYALPGWIASESKHSDASAPSSVLVPTSYEPVFVVPW